jgi:hypothetical protein
VLQHIETEIEEVRKAKEAGNLDELIKEWTDIAILGLDGLLRAVRAREECKPTSGNWPWISHDTVAFLAMQSLVAKQGKNEQRVWPDWRTMRADAPIEHDRTQGVQ